MSSQPSHDRWTSVRAYLGHKLARDSLGSDAPAPFRLDSMIRGGDRHWRAAMRQLGHEPIAVAACALAELALEVYSTAPDSSAEVLSKATDAVASLSTWKIAAGSPDSRAAVERNAIAFSVIVNVGEPLHDHAGFRGRSLGGIIGKCASVVLAPENPRHVRWFGEAAESLCHDFSVDEARVLRTVTEAFRPYLLADR